MLTLLRSNQPVATAIIPLMVVLFALLGLAFPQEAVALPELWAWLPASLGWAGNQWLHYALIAANALLINGLMNRHELSERNHNLTGWYFAVFYSILPVSEPVDPALVGGFFFLAGLNSVMKVYRQNEVAHYYFNGAFLIGVAAVVAQPFAIALALLIASVFYTRAVNWREVVLPVIGFCLPAAIFACLLWLFDAPLERIHFGATNARLSFGNAGIAALLGLLLLGLVGLTGMLRSFGSSSNKSKNSKAVLLIFILGAMAMAFFFYDGALPVVRYFAIAVGSFLFPWPLTGRLSTSGKMYFYATLAALFVLFLSLRGWI